MKLSPMLVFAGAALFAAGSAAAQTPPNPVLYMTSSEHYSAGGKYWVRHRYDVFNKDRFPAELFAPAPHLPPCGSNANSARSWIDFFDAKGRRLYGFCALKGPDQMGSIWFATAEGTIPPSWIYIEIHDRQTGKKYRSNLAETVL